MSEEELMAENHAKAELSVTATYGATPPQENDEY
jgi:hypothetical protein